MFHLPEAGPCNRLGSLRPEILKFSCSHCHGFSDDQQESRNQEKQVNLGAELLNLRTQRPNQVSLLCASHHSFHQTTLLLPNFLSRFLSRFCRQRRSINGSLYFLVHGQDRTFFEPLEGSCFCSTLILIADESRYFVLQNEELAMYALLANLNELIN